jgi:adenosylcobalamin-dependent ribonucleoside-triphosphate reductase
MGQAVAERTVLRKIDGKWETWGDVAARVAKGNALLAPGPKKEFDPFGPMVPPAPVFWEFLAMKRHISKATLLMSGRHLQHGDDKQPSRNQEVFTNCSTAASSFLSFYLLLNGSGVGRCYDDDMILIDWDNAPNLRVVLSDSHPNYDFSAHESSRDALHKYGPESKNVMWFKVPDSREGWAQALEVWETAAFEKIHRDKMLILDFSEVRARGLPIGGMQDRPASGPVPLMNAFMKAASLKGSGIPIWKQAMYVDHYFAECVLVGGARRAARMSTKWWRDEGIIDFIQVKRPIEFKGMTREEVTEYRKTNKPFGFLWSSNNSIAVDDEFYRLNALKRNDPEYKSEEARWARKVMKVALECSYGDGTGEPGFLNVHKLAKNDEGLNKIKAHDLVGSEKYQVREDTELLLSRLLKRARQKKYNMIVNPCSEIVLNVMGGYCVIADVVPYHADTLEEAEDAFRVATRALVRTNLMDSLYQSETKRTNRIGVGMTGVHEFAWKFFRVGFKDLVNPDFASVENDLPSEWSDAMLIADNVSARERAAYFWKTLKRFNVAINDEAEKYSNELGVTVPHTTTTIKPAGTTSKLFGLTEGWHLPSMKFYMRWVQFRSDDPLVKTYEAAGYPSQTLKTYEGTTIIGFPTAPVLAEIMPDDQIVTAAEATPEEQYKWLQLGEQYYIRGDHPERGNQISYTLKYDPEIVSFEDFSGMVKKHQGTISCCSVMPQEDSSSYEYTPEQSVTKAEYESVIHKINEGVKEEIDFSHIDCAGGACPIDFKQKEVA